MTERPFFYLGRRFFSAGSQSRLASFISLLAMAGLVLGVAILIIVLSVMNGFDHEMRHRILSVVPNLQLFEYEGVTDWQKQKVQLERLPTIREVTPFTAIQGLVNAKGKVTPVMVQGVMPEAMDGAMASILPDNLAEWLSADGMVLSSRLAEELSVSIGDKLTVMVPRAAGNNRQMTPNIRVFTLSGVINTHTLEDRDLALINLHSASELVGLGNRPQGLRITLEDVFTAREVGYQLLRQLPPGFSFVDWFQTHGNLYQAIQMSRKMVGLLIFLIIAIAIFNVVSMLVMTVVDKRPAIAILKTLGADNKTILGIFVVQGMLIGLLGCSLGIILGVFGAWGISDAVAWIEALFGMQLLNTAIYPIDYLPSQLQWSDVLVVATAALLLNLVATLYPAWIAMGIQPAKILRYE